jgi:c-di-GMP-binding flagellar brake protein YcgR
MTPQEIRPGTRLELELLNRSGERIGNIYVSQLLEVQNDGGLMISAPIFEARLIYIPLQAQIRLTFMHMKLGLLGFSAGVTNREYRGNIAVLIVQPEGGLEKIQRRNYYRLDHMTKALVWITGREDQLDRKSALKAFTKNISGSGLCIVTEADIPKNTEIHVEFEVNGMTMTAKCVVVRNGAFEIKNSKSYEIGLHFVKLAPKDQDSIIRYIFEQQRVQLKKETQ